MKFAFCLFKYFPYGGLQRGFLELARTCVNRGHELDVYTLSREGLLPENFNVFDIPCRHLTNHRRYQSFAKQVNRIIGAADYDAVVGFNKMPGLDIYFASDVCYAAMADQRSFLYRISGRCRTLKAMERAVFDKNSKTHIISISEKTKKQYIDYYGTDENRFHAVPPGISKERMALAHIPGTRQEWRREFDIQPTENVVLMVGSDYRRKGVDRAIKAMAALPRHLKDATRLVIVGKGGKRAYMRLARKLGVFSQVYFTGQRDDVPRFLAGADMLLHPAYHENTGTVLIEAMAAGLPVLATDACGYAGHIKSADAGKIVASPFRQEALNSMLAFMLDSQGKRRWRKNAKAYIAATDVSGRHEKSSDVIENIASGQILCSKP